MNNTAIETKRKTRNIKRKREDVSEEGKIIQLIVFSLGDEEFSANLDQVREVIRIGTIAPVPDSPDFIKGITNVRGEIAVVIGLRDRFSLPSDEKVKSKHIVMTERDNNLFGLMVDEVTEVLRIPETEISSTPELVKKIDRVYVSGVITRENRLIILLDLNKVVSEKELAELSDIQISQSADTEKSAEVATAKTTKSSKKIKGGRYEKNPDRR